jgi:hypothetical protein
MQTAPHLTPIVLLRGIIQRIAFWMTTLNMNGTLTLPLRNRSFLP